jgi:lysophospholipase L1-like esterase
MESALAGLCAVAMISASPGAATGQSAGQASGPAGPQFAALAQAAASYSAECKVNCPTFEGKAPLRKLRTALRERRPVKVLAIGSSSTSGVGASSPGATYPVRLESDLEVLFKGTDINVISRGVPGEAGHGAAERMRNEIADVKPDLVVWQVGTNDAMARVNTLAFAETLRSTVRWFQRNKIDVVLVDPQFVERLSTDDHYQTIVKTITRIAREERVAIVYRYDAMADLAKRNGESAYLANDRFHLNDLGYRCMAQYVAKAIIAGILTAEAEGLSQPSSN